MIDLKKITNELEEKICIVHNEKPDVTIKNQNIIKLKTCCQNFKKELEITYKNAVTKQTLDAIKGLFKK